MYAFGYTFVSCVCVTTFFFWKKRVSVTLCHTSGSRALFIGLTISFFSNFFIKNGSHGIIHIFKNYFAIMFSIFSKINSIQTDFMSLPIPTQKTSTIPQPPHNLHTFKNLWRKYHLGPYILESWSIWSLYFSSS